MGKLADALSAMRIHNNHNLLSRFGGERDVWVEYVPPDRVRAQKSAVYSITHQTDPNASWYDHGNKTFVGNRARSLPVALAWATETYGITEWAASPFGGKVPAHVLAKAKAAVKA